MAAAPRPRYLFDFLDFAKLSDRVEECQRPHGNKRVLFDSVSPWLKTAVRWP
jgi:hypothetical protein